jgi:DNA-binding HxlR family transcriptional regulator
MSQPPDHRVCSVARSLEILGDGWTFLVLREAFFGVKYFDQFQANLGIATNILSNRLKVLVENGIMQREKDKTDARRVEYRFTEKGRDLYQIVLAFMNWGDRWLADEEGPPLVLHHETCGNRLKPVMSCDHCGKAVDARDVTYKERSRQKSS